MSLTDYQKINTLFMRDENNIIMPNRMTCKEFEYLNECAWECTEKIDGTNIHVDIFVQSDQIDISFHGRTYKANIPPHLLAKLKELFTESKVKKAFEQTISSVSIKPYMISVYGEGYGMKIQKGGNYIKDGVNFILFDVRIGQWWLDRKSCEDIATKLGISIVPLIGYMSLPAAIDFVKKGFKSTIAENKDYDAEGLVLKTPYGLQFRNGDRIITKLKTVDFRKYKDKYGDGPVEQKINSNYNK